MAAWAFSVACSSASGPSNIKRFNGILRRSSAWRRRSCDPSSLSSRSRAIPTNWAPWPGNRKARRIGVDLLGLDDFAPVVIAAVAADRVRPLRLVALRALDELRALDRQVGAALTLAGMGVTSLWKGHERSIIGPPCVKGMAPGTS